MFYPTLQIEMQKCNFRVKKFRTLDSEYDRKTWDFGLKFRLHLEYLFYGSVPDDAHWEILKNFKIIIPTSYYEII